MNIYVCEQYHDNDCELFKTLEAANEHYDRCWNCDNLVVYDLDLAEPLQGTILRHAESKLQYCQKLHGERATEVNGQESRRMRKIREAVSA